MMDLKKVISKYLRDHNGEYPWPLGFKNQENLSPRAIAASKGLDTVELLILSRWNEIKKSRHLIFIELVERGMIVDVIAELAGVARSSVYRALKKVRNRTANKKLANNN